MSSIGKITGTVCRLTHNDGIKRLSLSIIGLPNQFSFPFTDDECIVFATIDNSRSLYASISPIDDNIDVIFIFFCNKFGISSIFQNLVFITY